MNEKSMTNSTQKLNKYVWQIEFNDMLLRDTARNNGTYVTVC